MQYIQQDAKDVIVDKFARHVSSGKVETWQGYGMDFIFGRRDGCYVWDVEGDKRLINCHCNGGVFNLGHRHPEIIATLTEAMTELDIGNHHLITEHRATLGARLAELTPGDIQYTVFGVSGGEAIDTAIKLARGYTRKTKVISAIGGYHGHTGLALAAGDSQYKAPFEPLAPGFVQVPFNDLPALRAEIDRDTAAVIFETIPATLGMRIADEDYFAGVRDLCDTHNAIMILDEVQSGLARTGKLWGIEHWPGVVPDILVTAKGLSGGMYPLTATCYRPFLNVFFDSNPFIHVSTFGGSEIGCHVALKVLDLSADPAFLHHVNEMAALFGEGLNTIQTKFPDVILDIRQRGLMIGIKMATEMCGPIMTKTFYDHGILTLHANNDPTVSQFLPPLIIDEAQARETLDRVEAAYEQAAPILRS